MFKPKFRRAYFILFFCLLPGYFYAQQLGIISTQISDKLPSQTVNQIFQDQEGNIWFATAEGVSKYDGYRVINFKPDDRQLQTSINSNNILSINETKDYLLVGTQEGLFLLDKKTYKFSIFPDKALKNKRISPIAVDSKQRIWIGTEGPIFVYTTNFSKLHFFEYAVNKAGSIPQSGSVSSIFEDDKGNIWTCFWGAGLYRYNEMNSQFIAYPKIGLSNNPFKIFQDDKKQYWIATWNDGLYLFDPNAKEKNIYREIIIKNRRRNGEKEGTFYGILQDNVKKYIWVLSYSGISALKHMLDGSVKEIDLSNLFENTTNNLSTIYKDKKGTIWLAFVGDGISLIDFNKPEIINHELLSIKDRYRIAPNPTMLYEDTNQKIWFNQSNIGLGVFDPKQNKVYMYSDYPQLKNMVSLRSVSCATQFGSEIWIGSTHVSNINVFEWKSGNIVLKNTIDLRKQVPQAGNPLSFFRDTKGNLWIATTNGVIKKTAKRNFFRAVPIESDHINGITEDTEGNIWIATRNEGIYCLRTNKQSTLYKFGKTGTDHIESIDADPKGNIWIGTKSSGLIVHNIAENTFRRFISPFLLSNNPILDAFYHDGNVWVSTSRRIFKINPHNKKTQEYSGEDGLNVNMFTKRSYFPNKKNKEIYFGGNRGISILKASKEVSGEKHKTVISDIKINNKSVISDNENQYDFKKPFLTLNPGDHNLEINFSALEYHHPYKVRYAYKLSGVDKDWVYPVGGRTFAIYNNLGKGHYNFIVKSTDVSKVWDNNITEFSIYKKPAFYESNIAYFIYLLFFLALAYFIIHFTLYKLKMRSDLHIAQIEKEKANELTQTKLKYFTNISHDLLTPLTIISCLIDDIEITNKKHLPQFEKMRSNLNRLKRLLQQILDFRKVESGSMALKISKGNIIQFIEEICITYFTPLAKKKNIDFKVTHHVKNTEAYFDADKIDKIVFNLLSNAFKYTPKDGAIYVELDISKKNTHTYFVLKISDTGIGIPPEEVDKIFIQFYNHKSSHKNESNGIGLALTKDLIKIHHGDIEVESLLQKGTCFTVQIPINKDSYSDIELEDLNTLIFDKDFPEETTELYDISVENNSKCDSQTLNLLLVEDNEDLLAIVKSVLSKNYNVLTACNGKLALELIKSSEIDIIISDVMMPELDGLELCKTLKNNTEYNHIPIILLTAKNSVNDRIESYNSGADAYISKPFDLKVLGARINSFIINKRTKQIRFKTSPEINISKLDYPTIDEQFLNNAIKTIEEHLMDSDFEVTHLADKLNMSKSTLYRKIKVLLSLSPSELIKNIRLKHACQMMDKDKSITVTEVAFATGFSDPRYFATCFKAEFGVTPSEYQKQYAEEV